MLLFPRCCVFVLRINSIRFNGRTLAVNYPSLLFGIEAKQVSLLFHINDSVLEIEIEIRFCRARTTN